MKKKNNITKAPKINDNDFGFASNNTLELVAGGNQNKLKKLFRRLPIVQDIIEIRKSRAEIIELRLQNLNIDQASRIMTAAAEAIQPETEKALQEMKLKAKLFDKIYFAWNSSVKTDFIEQVEDIMTEI